MKNFLYDNFTEIILILGVLCLFFTLNSYIKKNNEERLAIINNTKENVKKYSNCEYIENYYYCWNGK